MPLDIDTQLINAMQRMEHIHRDEIEYCLNMYCSDNNANDDDGDDYEDDFFSESFL